MLGNGSVCKSNVDCSSQGSCINNSCVCDTSFVGKTCEFSNPCLNSPCKNDGECVPVTEDGSYYCDCKIGYIEPHCEERNPCVLEGNNACLNGATCRRDDNFEFRCECRVPYVGEFCESYNLCEIDEDECIEDLHTEKSEDPFCYPCIIDANCTQISIAEYVCDCDSGINHSTCYLPTNYKVVARLRTPFIIESNTEAYPSRWNPIIPSIALSTCGLYFLLLLIVFLLIRKRAKYRPRLIVSCDIQAFDELSYYLISVETGKQWKAGTTSNVLCILLGENGMAGPYPISDKHLKRSHVLERGQEDNYLVSHTTDLGNILKILLWYDPRGRRDRWFCEKITVKNIKTEDYWLFYTSKWMPRKQSVHEFVAASPTEISKRNGLALSCIHYTMAYHTYLAPFFYIIPEKITLAFAEIMTYMLLLICLYGFLATPDLDFDPNTEYIWTMLVVRNGSLAAIYGFLLGILYTILFIMAHQERIPTLIVWRNRPGMPIVDEPKLMEQTQPTEKIKSKTTILTKTKKHRRIRVPLQRTHSDFYKEDDPFRIPSTDILKTETWVYDMAKGTLGPEELTNGQLVHNYIPYTDPVNMPKYLVEYGFIGSLRGVRQQEPDSFIYNVDPYNSTNVKSLIEDDIRDSYELQMGPHLIDPEELKELKPTISYEMIDVLVSETESNTSEIFVSNDHSRTKIKSTTDDGDKTKPEVNNVHINPSGIGDGDNNGQSVEEIKRSLKIQVYCELCEMEHQKSRKTRARICITTAWLVCITVIVAATVICCIYGSRYGYQRTYDWCLSLVICFLQNLLVYQLLKIVTILIIVLLLVNKKKLLKLEDQRNKERFQVFYANGLTVLPRTHSLKFIQYLPKFWVFVPPIKIVDKTPKNTHVKSAAASHAAISKERD